MTLQFWSRPPFRSSIPLDPRFQFKKHDGDTDVYYLKLLGRVDDDISVLQVKVCHFVLMKEPNSFQELEGKRIAHGLENRVGHIS